MWINLLLQDWALLCVLSLLVSCLFVPLILTISQNTSLVGLVREGLLILSLGSYFSVLWLLHLFTDGYFTIG